MASSVLAAEVGECGDDLLAQRHAVGDAGGIGGEIADRRQVVEADDGAELLELAVIADGEDEMAVAHRQHLVGRDVRMRIAHLHRRIAGHQIVEVLVGEHRDLGIEQRHVDVLALAGRFGVAQRRLDGDDRIEAGEDVGDGDADLLRLAAGSPVIDIMPDMPWTMKS